MVPYDVDQQDAVAGGSADMAGRPHHGPLSAETLAPPLRRPWDPATHIISQHNLRRLPNNPLLVLVPSSPCHGSDASRPGFGTGRLDFWQGGRHQRVRGRRAEPRHHRQREPVAHHGHEPESGSRAAAARPAAGPARPAWWPPTWRWSSPSPDDPLLESRTPTLLLVGQSASGAAPHELELMRDRMRAKTGLVVVGGADRRLLVNRHERQREGLTQSMVDRAVMEEVSEFLTNILTQQLDGTLPVFPRLPTPPLCREDAVLRNLARERRRRPVGPAKHRARPTRSGRPRSRPRPPIIDLIQEAGSGTPEPEPFPLPAGVRPAPGCRLRVTQSLDGGRFRRSRGTPPFAAVR
ncbi:KAT8 regulatory NSL complex subunit 3-like [Pollicipes pollicipes]|uniref:KAT8 regulatory NSL complex subunit 3-like n=1 Tax=Pollicipes pollicipes TaxID=41117 RepID=UPI001884F07C|nr:KAT8 regulatory NSL complex subunit 3-like [Pollicipes pollicipes]